MGRLFLRVFLWFWLGSSALVIVFGLSLANVFPDAVTTWRFIGRTAMRALGSEMANAYEREGAAAALAIASAAGREGGFRVWLYSLDGHLLAGPPEAPEAHDAVSRAVTEHESERLTAGGATLLARRATSASGGSYIVLWDAPRALRSSMQPSAPRFLLRVGALLLVGAVVCLALVWPIVRPIGTLRRAARRVAAGDLSVRVAQSRELRRGDELAELAVDFDHMTSRIEELIGSQRQLLADISHELRSPLARASLALDLARRRIGADIPEHARIEREVQRLDELIDQLLTLARLQAGRQHPREPIDLGELVFDVARDAHFEAQAAGRAVVVEEGCTATVSGERHLLRSAIENVVRNAVRHTAERTTVTISLTCDEAASRAALVVRDRGTGVPPEALARLFDPFFRVDGARDRERGGAGLGLAITKQAILAHGGSVRAENDPEGGLMVRMELPVEGGQRR